MATASEMTTVLPLTVVRSVVGRFAVWLFTIWLICTAELAAGVGTRISSTSHSWSTYVVTTPTDLAVALQPTQTHAFAFDPTDYNQVRQETRYAPGVTSIAPAQITQIHQDLSAYYATAKNSDSEVTKLSSAARAAYTSYHTILHDFIKTASRAPEAIEVDAELQDIAADIATEPLGAVLSEASHYLRDKPYATKGVAYVSNVAALDAHKDTVLRNIITSDLSLTSFPSSTVDATSSGTVTPGTTSSSTGPASSTASNAADSLGTDARLLSAAMSLMASLLGMACL